MQEQFKENDWRRYLSDEEFKQWDEDQTQSRILNADRKSITDRLNRLRNNCAQRRRSAIGVLSDAKRA